MSAGVPSQMIAAEVDLARHVARRYKLHDVGLRHLGTPVNDVFAVTSAEGEFALKLYHRNRTLTAVQWEIDLLIHLYRRGAPVVQPIHGRNGYLEHLTVDRQQYVAAFFTWAAGSKPTPGDETYGLLGEAAARIHRAADSFAPSAVRENYDAVGDLRVVAWKLGVAESSRGAPLLRRTGSARHC
jgi:Ser/Thr protein kinase RdoA (MazF antagonist)